MTCQVPNQVDSAAPKTKIKREKVMIILVDKKAFDKVQYNLWKKKKKTPLSRVGKKQTLSLIKDVYENLQLT